jgi:hypothetical protein
VTRAVLPKASKRSARVHVGRMATSCAGGNAMQHVVGTALFEVRPSLASVSHFEPSLTESRTTVR